jgi:hypothetical protein
MSSVLLLLMMLLVMVVVVLVLPFVFVAQPLACCPATGMCTHMAYRVTGTRCCWQVFKAPCMQVSV